MRFRLGEKPLNFRSVAHWWLDPRATNRDEAYRERVIRSTLAITITFTLLSFLAGVFAFENEWGILSWPTLHVAGLTGLFASAITVSRKKLFLSGWILVFTVVLGASGVILLDKQEGQSLGILIAGGPTFMLVPLLAASVLPRKYILTIGVIASTVYIASLFGVPPKTQAAFGLTIDETAISIYLLILVESALLRQIRVEFDARLNAMRESIEQTEHARREAELAQKRAEQADKAKTQFLANMSHELRTPLNAIIGYSEAMIGGMAGTFSDQQIKLLGHIQHNGHRLLALINDVLDLSKIESGSLEVFLGPTSPRTSITQTVESLRSLADENNVDLQVIFDDAFPEMIVSDSKKLEQIVVNLVSNAIKFTSGGSVTVDIRPVGKTTWILEVRDTGIGMPPDAARYIFEPFRQVDGSSTRKHKGTGLGLAITKRLIDCLGGDIEVSSELGKGSTFRVSLPLQEAPQSDGDPVVADVSSG